MGLRRDFRLQIPICVLLVLVLLPLAKSGSPPASATPDLLLLNAHVITMAPGQPSAEAIAVSGGRIAWVGTGADAGRLYPGAASVLDLRGATVLPGIIDSHTHLMELGKSLLQLNLKDAPSDKEAVEPVKQRVATAKPGEWILGWGWDEGKWAAHYPDNRALSAVSPNNPVYLVGLHTFAAWANKRALALAGIDKNTADPENGKILRDPQTGEPTGILLNHAQKLVESHIPPMTLPRVGQAFELAAREGARNGWTSVHKAKGTPIMVDAFRDLVRKNRMPLRVYAMLDGANQQMVATWLQRGPEIDPQHRLTIRAFKLFADGALGSRGAALLEPYSDAPQTRGLMTTPEPAVYDLTRRALQRGFQVCTHAIGDRANRLVLDAYERALREVPTARSPRLRVEHAQVLAPQDIPRFSKLDVIASMQPTHCTSDKAWAEARLGPQRVKGAYAWQSVLKTGAHLPLSSDFRGETLNPFYGIYAAITRQDPQGNPPGGWYPEQRLTLAEALRGYTLEGAFAEFDEKDKGSIEAGKLADFTVIDLDPAKVPPKDILNTRVLKTIVGGQVVYDSANSEMR